MTLNHARPAVRPPNPEGVTFVRSHLSADSRERSTPKGAALFAGAAALYAATFAGILLAPGWPLKIAAACVHHVCVDVLFVIGHDACHGSLTPRAWLNKLLGRLAFLPSLHPYAAWEHSHNGLHHGWTNVRGRDPIFAPMRLAEYRALPGWRRAVERLYRSPIGLGLYYLVEVWWKYEAFPNAARRPRSDRRSVFRADRALVAGFLAAQAVALVAWARHAGVSPLAMLAVGAALPFLLFNAAMGFVIYQHHTHPRVPWYADERDWSFFRGQVRSVVHVEFPSVVDAVLHHIMDHTAHHVDTRVPLYHLPAAQRRLEHAYAGHVVTLAWTARGFLETLATCRLYDFDHHQWLDWDGTPTTAPLVGVGPPIASGAAHSDEGYL